MALGTKAFVWLLPGDWRDGGVLEGLAPEAAGLTLSEGAGKGVFISERLDALEAETVWHQLRLTAELPENTTVQVRLYCTDQKETRLPDGDFADLESFLIEESRPIREKEQFFHARAGQVCDGLMEVPLYGLKGRYLWFCLTLLRYGEEAPCVRKMELSFPRISFLDYLPQVYRGAGGENSFLSRFIGVFQSVYLGLEDGMDQIPALFDPGSTGAPFLRWLAGWLAVSESFLWEDEELRAFLQHAAGLYRRKGTLAALKEVISLYTGQTPMIVEQFSAASASLWERDQETLQRLYGEDDRTFTVLLPAGRLKPGLYPRLMKIIDRFRPVDTICSLVFYEDAIRLGAHCYLGVNSMIGASRRFVLEDSGQAAGAPYL